MIKGEAVVEGKRGASVADIWKTAVSVILSPVTFFRTMPTTGGLTEPLLFMVAMGVITGLLTDLLGLFGLTTIFSTGMAVAAVILIPVAYGVLGFVGAAVISLVWKLMGSPEPYETSYRCVAYIAAFMPIVTVLDVVPVAGRIVTAAIVAYLYATASIEAHKLPVRKSWLVFGTIGILYAAAGFIGR